MKYDRLIVAVLVVSLLFLGVASLFASGQKGKGEAAAVPEGKRIAEVGPYIARTGVKGEVIFTNAWGGTRIPLMQKGIEEFNVHYPNITVKSEVSKASDMEKLNLSAIAAGNPPGVMMLRADVIPFMVKEKVLLPLDDLVERDELKPYEVFYKGELDTRKYEGKLWGLPQVVGGSRHFVYYNLDLLAKIGLDANNLPQTWQDLDKWADVVKSGLPGSYLLEPNHTCGSHPPLLVWMTTNNGKYINDDLTKITFNSPEGLETLTWLLQFVKRQAANYAEMAMTEAKRFDCDLPPQSYAKGVYVAQTSGVHRVNQLRTAVPDLKWTATMLPYNGKNPKAEFGTPTFAGWAFMIPASLKDPNPAWEWVKYACAGEGQANFIVRRQVRASPAKIYNDDPIPAKENPIWDTVIADLAAAKPIPVTPVHPDLREIMYSLTEEVLYEKKSPKEALESGAAKAQKVLDEWNAKR
jgi:multiple sugar transport system substrate-binding protein